MFKFICLIYFFYFGSLYVCADEESPRLLVVTIATDETDGYKRFKDSADKFGLDVLVLGMHEEWKGGNVRLTTGGGFKVNLLRRGLAKYKDDKDLVIFFTDSYDVVFLTGKDEIIPTFKEFNAKIVFSAESTVWPDPSLQDDYPDVAVGKRYLCSGGIIGYADVFWETITQWELEDEDDDQLYYTKIYINTQLRTKLNATLDHTSKLVQNINFAKSELEVVERDDDEITRVKNNKYSTYPCVIHGNGPSKLFLNHISNYAPDGWHSDHGCRKCDYGVINVEDINSHDEVKVWKEQQVVFLTHPNILGSHSFEVDLPTVQLAVFVEQPTPFFAEFLDKLSALDYPKNKIALFVHVTDEDCERILSKFLLRHRTSYSNVHVIGPHDFTDQSTARNMAVDECVKTSCDYQLTVDAYVQITDPKILKFLISKNKQMVAPLIKREGKLWSNFWGALNVDGYYARSDDYMDIVNGERTGIWNVPFINAMYLTKGETLKHLRGKDLQPYSYDNLDPDMAYCSHLRDEGIFMFVDNEDEFGRLLHVDNVKTDQVQADLWQIKDNPTDWEDKYIHPGFWAQTHDDTVVSQPCPDVYMFPLFTEHAADAIVDVMETYGQWSGGKNKDERLAGGYENVPTVDIHMNQVGYDKEWLHLLATYPTKIIEKVYPGFYTKAHSIMMFVVRYRPSEQSFLRPHHDSSTWTMNVALNTHDVDYEGGGCRFLRYNCSVTKIPKGYALVHPGRLTHYHEGLETTKGTRYIAVSFVDP